MSAEPETVTEVAAKKFICPQCRHTEPIYLKKVAGIRKDQIDYSTIPVCPQCLTRGLFGLTCRMQER